MAEHAYQDPEAELHDRVEDLLRLMDIDEKLAQLSGVTSASLLSAEGFDVSAAEDTLSHGVGQIIPRGVGEGPVTPLTPEAYASFANKLQTYLVEQTRLGIPAILHEDLSSGLQLVDAANFPNNLGLAATFAPALVQRAAEVYARQMRAVGIRMAMAPELGLVRGSSLPVNENSFGSDAYLVGRMGVALVRGLQTEDIRSGVAACAKYFLGADTPATGLDVGPRRLRESYAEPFAAVIRETNLAGVLSANQCIDGLPCSGSAGLLTALLCEELGFDGLIMADYHAIARLVNEHQVAADGRAAAALAISAGVHVELPIADCFGEALQSAITEKKVSEELVDEAVRRVLKLKMAMGLFEQPYVAVEQAVDSFGRAKQNQLASSIACKAVVLLKNSGVLPLQTEQPLFLLDLGVPGSTGIQVANFTQALESRVSFEQPNNSTEPSSSSPMKDGSLLLCLADFTNADIRPRLASWREDGLSLILLVFGGDLKDIVPLMDLVDGLVLVPQASRPAAAAGAKVISEAVVQILLGECYPSGRLPLAIPYQPLEPDGTGHRVDAERTPGSEKDSLATTTEHGFGFGFGLSYAEFSYDEFECTEVVDIRGLIQLDVRIRNLADSEADEVAQIYISDNVADTVRPVRKLAGFRRVSLAAKEAKRLTFHIDLSQVAYFNQDLEFVVDPGLIEVFVGASSVDIHHQAIVEVQGDRRKLQQRQIVATQVTVSET